jgi:ubiquinone/menaquinone biosynthesis C-methylase UbiE
MRAAAALLPPARRAAAAAAAAAQLQAAAGVSTSGGAWFQGERPAGDEDTADFGALGRGRAGGGGSRGQRHPRAQQGAARRPRRRAEGPRHAPRRQRATRLGGSAGHAPPPTTSPAPPPPPPHPPPKGFRTVPRAEKAGLVGEVFHSVASSYDVMNDLMSGGLHRLWKDRWGVEWGSRGAAAGVRAPGARPEGCGARGVARQCAAAGVGAGRAGNPHPPACAPTSSLPLPTQNACQHRLVEVLRPFPGMRHLDVAGGTGDVAFRVLAAIQAAEAAEAVAGGGGSTAAASGSSGAAGGGAAGGGEAAGDAAGAGPGPGTVTVCDINASMLAVGRGKAASAGLLGRTEWVEGDAERLPFADGSMDAYTIAFGIRNVTDRAAALAEARRVLRRGGRFLCLEFSQARGGAAGRG